ncbi:hypothetical protein LOTGIDRAFT_162476 [Lottia gigantea]|uniref:Ubiquitin-like domain-containing protein n=1 Tax=Lottia gigantea TaxID=225164 RepID=V3ZMH2_LOTGI|nr:hypothetical protein LOTGIDRAFT_162476 [Lottia gigantea]ESO92568.1 hypothetical protein LOTGIDRAFT_162476 [Lottia gigantea]
MILFWFLLEDNVEMIEEYNEEDNFISELESTPDKSLIKLLLHDTDTALNIKSSLVIKLLKAASNIHIYYKNKELRNEDVISDLRDGDQSNSKIFQVQLSRK